MADVWKFGDPVDTSEPYGDGTSVPHRIQSVLLNGKHVGYVEIHMHRRRGTDKITDASFGFTGVVYGPLPDGDGK